AGVTQAREGVFAADEGKQEAAVLASGSVAELEYPLLLARDLAYLSADVHRPLDALVGEVKRRLYRFIQTLADA
ncbi:four helix bundle protein, partial [Myxococcota bacterium]